MGREVVGAILLLGRSGSRTVRASRIFVRRSLRSRGILIIRQLIFALETRLNFVDDAEVADEFGASRIDKMCLAIGALVDLGGREIGDTRLLPRKNW